MQYYAMYLPVYDVTWTAYHPFIHYSMVKTAIIVIMDQYRKPPNGFSATFRVKTVSVTHYHV